MNPWQRVEPLGQHDLGAFSCGDPDMDEWVTQKAAAAHARETVKVRVCVDAFGRVIAVFAFDFIVLAPAEVSRNDSGGLAKVNTLLLARFALHVDYRGDGHGPRLMAEVLREAVAIAEGVPVRVLALDAKNERLAEWYASLDFKPTRTNPLRMYMPMKRVRASVEAADAALADGDAA